ncbi:MAG: isoamylase early set domain-containing protein [Rectinema sp.]|jgi:hypothetical protein|uniref:Glycoside hydrolase family 13 N-terminal domain-containing protein n=1 Tax=uncultured spirochete TaxID=156406 RepID=A0A3P3XQM3_9SPIR|nr:hypothetical protein SPIRO4BDMA_50133 [uncultured spirochete]
MMNCTEARAFVDAWERGERGMMTSSLDEFRMHLADCETCAHEFRALLPFIERDANTEANIAADSGVGSARRSGTLGSVPSEFADGVMKAIGGEKRPSHIIRSRPALVAAAAAIFILGLSLGLYFGTRTKDTVSVKFVLYAPEASTVELAGDFTSWNPGTYVLKKASVDGMWEVLVPLKKGRVYVYNFVIDGDRWISDPKAAVQVDDGFGGSSSLLRL